MTERSPQAAALTDLILELFRVNGLLLEAGDRLAAPFGLTSARWQVLGAIEGEGRPLTVAQIGRRMGLTRQAVQRVVNDLEGLGFVTLEDNPDHKRARLVVMTPACSAVMAGLDARQTGWANALGEGLSAEAIRAARLLLAEIGERCAALDAPGSETET